MSQREMGTMSEQGENKARATLARIRDLRQFAQSGLEDMRILYQDLPGGTFNAVIFGVVLGLTDSPTMLRETLLNMLACNDWDELEQLVHRVADLTDVSL